MYAGVAQLVEQLIRNQQVAGSSPATSSNCPRKQKFLRALFLIRVKTVYLTSVYVEPSPATNYFSILLS